MRAIDVWVILCYVGVFSTLVEYCFVLYLTKSSILDSKGGLISQRFSLRLKSAKKVPNHSREHYPPKEKMLRRVTELFFSIFELK